MKRSSMYSVFFRFFAFASSVRRAKSRRACATDAKALSLPSSASVLRRRRRSKEPKEPKRGEGCTEPKPKNRSATEEPMRTEVAALRLRLRFLSLLLLRSRVGAPRLFALRTEARRLFALRTEEAPMRREPSPPLLRCACATEEASEVAAVRLRLRFFGFLRFFGSQSEKPTRKRTERKK
uniref:Uncharacterized protein n=1 Tax=Pediastrum duplex TaxID=3105 RepID=A0A2U8GI27_PEDDU|nr:hypothetical protein [Pediastrum duplex]AWI68328.1 hypothetical protein [Pediastrum duplex]